MKPGVSLQGKHIVLGVSGGIAAYKTPALVRLLVQAGAEVRVVCTAHALEFVTPLTLETVSGHGVYSDMFHGGGERTTRHIHYADWGDLLIVAPATADILAKMAHGIADDALSTLYLAFHKPVLVAPAMNVHMYGHPATTDNLRRLAQRGVKVLEAAYGPLACGCEAKGRMPEPEEIVRAAEAFLAEAGTGGGGGDATCAGVASSAPGTEETRALSGKKVLVTAGPTQEPIDPVRYITNRSSGRMGFCIADALQRLGAEVFLISGPSALRPEMPVAHWEKVRTAQEMYDALLRWWPDMDAGVFSAAVADYRVRDVSDVKIKKTGGETQLELVPNPDLLAYAGAHKTDRQCVVGFALETDHALANAEEKRRRKNADIMVLNTLEDKGAGFETPTNKVTLLYKDREAEVCPLEGKPQVAERIVRRLARYLKALICLWLFGLLGIAGIDGAAGLGGAAGKGMAGGLRAQELNCTLQVVTTKIQSGDKKVFETLQEALAAFVNGQKWTSLQVGNGEKIPCSMTLEIQERDQSNGSMKAYLTVQARRPVYNASYQTNLLNIVDRDIAFVYNEFDPIEFSDNNISSNLTAVLAYYSYLIIGLYLDSFALNAGEVCFNKADNVVSQCQGMSEAGWKASERNTRNRYWMIENYMNGAYGAMHQVMYQYHRKGLDVMYGNPTEGRAGILQALTELKALNDTRNNLPCKMLFMEAKSDELVSMFSGASQDERQRAVSLLNSLDPSNVNKYQRIMQVR